MPRLGAIGWVRIRSAKPTNWVRIQSALTSRLRSQQRRAGATVISCPPAHGRAFAPGPTGSGLIAGLPEDKRPKISRSFRAAPLKPDCRAARAGFLRTVSALFRTSFLAAGPSPGSEPPSGTDSLAARPSSLFWTPCKVRPAVLKLRITKVYNLIVHLTCQISHADLGKPIR
jgi:hypothetical protein